MPLTRPQTPHQQNYPNWVACHLLYVNIVEREDKRAIRKYVLQVDI
jgi:hypothetical protein